MLICLEKYFMCKLRNLLPMLSNKIDKNHQNTNQTSLPPKNSEQSPNQSSKIILRKTVITIFVRGSRKTRFIPIHSYSHFIPLPLLFCTELHSNQIKHSNATHQLTHSHLRVELRSRVNQQDQPSQPARL